MFIRATIKWPGYDGELVIEAGDGLDFANQLRRLNREFKPGEDINFNSEDIVFAYHNTSDDDSDDPNSALGIINHKYQKKATVEQNFLTTDQNSEFYEPSTRGEFYIPENIQTLKRLLVDDIDLSSEDERFIARYCAHFAAYEANKAGSLEERAANPIPAQDDQNKYQGLITAGKVKAYQLKQWREKKGDTLDKKPAASLAGIKGVNWDGLEKTIKIEGKDVKVPSNDLLDSGTAGYERLWKEYQDYRDNANHDMIPDTCKDLAAKEAWLLKHKEQTVIQVYCSAPEDKFNQRFASFAKARQSSVPNALGSAWRSLFTWRNLFNPFTWITLGVSALVVLAFVAGFSAPEVIAAVAPVFIKISVFGGVIGGLALLCYVPWVIATDIASKADEIHASMDYALDGMRPGVDADGNRCMVDRADDQKHLDYYLKFARVYAEGLWNRFRNWRINHPAQFVGVAAGVVAFALLTLFTASFLGHVPGFEFMQPVMDFLTGMINTGLAGITSVGSAAEPMSLVMAATFLIVGPLAFAHVATGLGQTAHEAQYAANRLDADSELEQDGVRGSTNITVDWIDWVEKQTDFVKKQTASLTSRVHQVEQNQDDLFARLPKKDGDAKGPTENSNKVPGKQSSSSGSSD